MQTEHFKVTGMTCSGCISNVTHALQAVSGVGDVSVSLSAGEATVQYDELQTSPDAAEIGPQKRRLRCGWDRFRAQSSIQGWLLRLAGPNMSGTTGRSDDH